MLNHFSFEVIKLDTVAKTSNKMKGVIFTTYLELVETHFGPEVTDRMIEESEVESGGAYTAVGTYDHKEMVAMVGKLSSMTDIPEVELYKIYGKNLFSLLAKGYKSMLKDIKTPFQLLSKLEDYIHVEVLKLYPEAELPRFDTRVINENQLEMVYHSKRGFSDLAIGLIEGCFEHYEQTCTIDKEMMDEEGHKVKLTITQKAE